MSDSEVECLEDGMGGDSGMMDGATTLGAAQRFDAETGRVVGSGSDNMMHGSSAQILPDSSSLRDMDSSDTAEVSGSVVDDWTLSLSEKNASNTFDLSAAHMVGIDEAGRGPVLGSMVYGICWCPTEKLEELKAIKVADSKTLTLAQREQLFRKIQETPWLGYEVDVITAERLSREMMRRMRVNLNTISHDSAIGLIQRVIAHGVNVREVYVDTVGDASKYQEKLSALFPNIQITVAKKADALYPVVSAASIAAKVTRDLNLERWKFIEERPPVIAGSGSITNNATSQPSSSSASIHPSPLPTLTPTPSPPLSSLLPRFSRRFGSGYPGDPLTKVWLSNALDPVFGYTRLVRFSWGTTKKILKAQTVQVEWGDDDDEEEEGEEGDEGGADGAGSQKMDQFFTATPGSNSTSKGNTSKATSSVPAPAPATLSSTSHPNARKFSPLHDSITRKSVAIPCRTRSGWFQQHQMDCATTF